VGPTDSNLLSVIAHELRAPLAAMLVSSELLLDSLETPDAGQVERMARSVHRGAVWLQSLVENLICAATIREGRFQVRSVPTLLQDIVAEIQPVVEPLLASKRQNLSTVPGDSACELWADGRRIGQVLINLILNASKFAPAGTTIGLMIAAEPRRARITVSDRGPGLGRENAARLFEPYYQGAVGQANSKGIGLGLAIARAIVEAHNGSIGARNRRGGGACFWFDLPRLPRSGAAGAPGGDR
jgi:K+-sensing histidine kinase KdpD